MVSVPKDGGRIETRLEKPLAQCPAHGRCSVNTVLQRRETGTPKERCARGIWPEHGRGAAAGPSQPTAALHIPRFAGTPPAAGAASTVSGLCSPPAEAASSKTLNINSLALRPLPTRPPTASERVLVLRQPRPHWSPCFHPDVLWSDNPPMSPHSLEFPICKMRIITPVAS